MNMLLYNRKKIQRETQLTRKEKGREGNTPFVCEERRRGRS
jgi:hypothetical protein